MKQERQMSFIAPEPKTCENCRNYARFVEPHSIKGGYQVFGICYKPIKIVAIENRGYPVYVPGASCRDYVRKKDHNV